ncbi:MAG: methylornithine synthase PylB [Desulfosarcina sp.]|nr:methylornithine synthase PylB [Desulfosarcina sp.]MBC2764746.1 methylornithine synthase PylB [Desulfosarcina sp.]
MNHFHSKPASVLKALLDKAQNGCGLSPAEMRWLMSLKTPDELEALFAAARWLRQRHFGQKIFLYGFLYVSTHCRNHCTFCLYRRGNPEAPRYRKSRDEIVALASKLARTGVHLIDLTMGEDPALYGGGEKGFEDLHGTLEAVIEATGLPVMASVGVVPSAVLDRFARQGVSWYACYQETHSRSLFARLRGGQNYDDRLQGKRKAHELGLLFEEGLLTGVGETREDLLKSLTAMQQLDADQVRVMTFVPQKGTPMAAVSSPDPLQELKMIALMRICMPDRLIPASLDIDGLAGLRQRLNAGANVVTSLVPSGEGLAGVAQSELDIEAGGRSIVGIQSVLDACGLSPATPAQYRQWIHQRQQVVERRVLDKNCQMNAKHKRQKETRSWQFI